MRIKIPNQLMPWITTLSLGLILSACGSTSNNDATVIAQDKATMIAMATAIAEEKNEPPETSTIAPTNTPLSPTVAATATPTTPAETSTTAPTNTPLPLTVTATATATPTPLPAATATSRPLPTYTVSAAQAVEGLKIGNLAPDFTLGSNRASRVSLSDLRGKIVILNFWATWCPPCRHEVPELQAIHNEYGPQGVVVLAINEGERLENVERFAHDTGISFAVWLDEDQWVGNVYNIHSIPTTYFIDETGIIRAVQFGSMTRDQVIKHLENLL